MVEIKIQRVAKMSSDLVFQNPLFSVQIFGLSLNVELIFYRYLWCPEIIRLISLKKDNVMEPCSMIIIENSRLFLLFQVI